MKLSEYLLDRIFSLICMLVAALVLLALLWLIETPAVFILFAEVILLAAYSTALLYDFFRKQVLYYARSTDVEKDFKVEKTTLQALVYAALKTYSKPLIQVGGKPVLKELDIPVAADSKSCTFVIGQILSNAIKYRKDNLQVEFSARAEKNTVSLFISDNGIGISAADLPRVFDKGFTGENGRRYSKSTGIGLYLSQRLCRKMNISLSISSVPGQGTTVTMVFPTESYLQAAGL